MQTLVFLLMLLFVHILVSEHDAPTARPFLLATSSSLVPLGSFHPGTQTGQLVSVAYYRSLLLLVHRHRQSSAPLSSRCLFSVQILYPLSLWMLLTSLCHPSSDSSSTAMSSSNLRLLITCPDMIAPSSVYSVASAITTSRKILNRRGDIMQPCKTPTRVPTIRYYLRMVWNSCGRLTTLHDVASSVPYLSIGKRHFWQHRAWHQQRWDRISH